MERWQNHSGKSLLQFGIMKVHTTNYFDTFIEVAEDTKTDRGTKNSQSFNELEWKIHNHISGRQRICPEIKRTFSKQNDT
jgi:hypothetical protein